jgi:hypothetical protein
MSNYKKDSGGCLGCLGTLVFLTFLGSLFFGGGVLMRVGSLGFSLGKDPIDRKQIVNNYLAELEVSKKVAEAEIEQLHLQINQGRCQHIFDRGSETLKKNLSQSQVANFCEKIKLNLGSIRSSQLTDWWGRSTDPDSTHYIFLRYMTSFSKTNVRETFIWLVKDSKAELVEYEIYPASKL